MRALTIARFTVAEAVKRRLVVTGTLVSALFAALFIAGFSLLDARGDGPAETALSAFGSTLLTVFGLYSVYFLAGLLAVLLGVGAVSGEIDAGTLHAVLARPLRRRDYLVGRWLGLTAILALYVTFMAGGLLLAAHLIAGYTALNPLMAIGLLAVQAAAMLSLALLGSTVLPTLANGVVVLSLFGLAWLGGIIATVGRALDNAAMTTLATAVGVAVPSDMVWRAASYFAQSPLLLAAGDVPGIPFASSHPPSAALVAWGVAYPAVVLGLAALAFARRDL
ncbi:MAG TPA: ABC transporter permease subunit [Egibacteraceae bacterium]|nr:ABC transporter permease subunit [Egibacteraceae bacterium]